MATQPRDSMTRKNRPAVAACACLLFVALVTMQAALPAAPASAGQTIPWLTFTPTPAATHTPRPTQTLPPVPTWTAAPTRRPPGVTPTGTPGPEPPLPTATHAGAATPTPAPPGSPAPGLPTSPASPLNTPAPAALQMQVLVHPPAAGPGDAVHLTVQVAAVGRGPASNVRVEAALPALLLPLRASSACDRCIALAQRQGLLTLSCEHLASGDQLLASFWVTVHEDAWPGQTLTIAWSLTADGLAAQTTQTSLELPWAALPATARPAPPRRGRPAPPRQGRPPADAPTLISGNQGRDASGSSQ